MIVIHRDPGNSRLDHVYLLPKTIDYYQEELTRLLETERFGEATEMLAFLLQCRTDDAIAVAEWQHLYDWLVNTFGEPEFSAGGPSVPGGEEEEDVSERDLRKRRLDAKVAGDPAYVDKLLRIVLHESDLEKKMLAVDQLALVEDPRIDAVLVGWLEEAPLHPLLQFKVLQALRTRGGKERVTLHRAGETVTVQVDQTPLGMDDYPAVIRSVPDRVREVCELTEPAMAGFAEHVWQEFLACIFGTSLYRVLEGMDRHAAAVWAAGLHEFMIVSVTGADPQEPLLPQYKLGEREAERVRKSRNLILAYMRNSYGPE